MTALRTGLSSSREGETGGDKRGTPGQEDPVVRDAAQSAKKRGSLAQTLDPLLQPRSAARPVGRPKGVSNHIWTADDDEVLVKLCGTRGTKKAKTIMARTIQERRQEGPAITWDAARKAVERRIFKLGIPGLEKREAPPVRAAQRWTETQVATLLGALGADATLESIAARTGHTVKSVRAKIARLDYGIHEVYGTSVFTVNSLADLLHVTPRQVRRWKENGWLETKDRHITEATLGGLLRNHPDRIPFDVLGPEAQVYLADLGYPCAKASTFRKNVREILDGIGRQRKPRRPPPKTSVASEASKPQMENEGVARSAGMGRAETG